MSLEDYVLILKNNQDALTELPTKTLLQKEIKVNGMKGEILEIETEITQGDKKIISKGKKAILEGKNGFYQVYVWTLKEDFKKYEPDFDRIIGSFKEL
jgi:inorganic pyrophosphatase/exopolyphosphatase